MFDLRIKVCFLTAIAIGAAFVLRAAAYADDLPNDAFVVGAILPLTGPTAEYGQAVANAFELAKEDAPDLFKKVSFVYEDARYESMAAVTAFQKLVKVNRVNAVFTWGVPYCNALAPLAEQSKTMTFGECVYALAGLNKKYFLRFMNPADQYAELQAAFLESRNIKRIGVVISDNAYLEALFESLKRALRPGQTAVVLQRYQPEQMDLRDAVVKIKQDNYDALGVFLGAGQIAEFYKLLKAQNLNTTTFGTNFFESLSEVDAAGSAMDGAYYVNNEVRDAFAQRYEKKFGNLSQLAFAAPAYEFALSLGRAVTQDPSEAAVLQSFVTIEQGGVATGPFRFRETANGGKFFEFPLTVKCIHGRNFRALASDAWSTNECR